MKYSKAFLEGLYDVLKSGVEGSLADGSFFYPTGCTYLNSFTVFLLVLITMKISHLILGVFQFVVVSRFF